MLEAETEISQREAISILKYFDLEPVNVETIIKDHQLVRESIISLYEESIFFLCALIRIFIFFSYIKIIDLPYFSIKCSYKYFH